MPGSVFINGKSVRLTPDMVVGQGGEAVIYRLPGDKVLKLYMEPDDPAYDNNPAAQAGAAQRLLEQQRKLPAFPGNMPARVIAPVDLAYDRSGGTVRGFTMAFLKDMEVLLSFSERKFREASGIDPNRVVGIFRDLYGLVREVHKRQVVIGDFNDLNVMVGLSDQKDQTYLVDADSMQFGQFHCRSFTNRFVDPLHCEPDKLLLSRPHSQESDWYAFATMLFQCLLYINPFFGGVHRPKVKQSTAYRNDDRVLHRISVFSPDVVYPKVAMPLQSLPDDLLDLFQRIFERDVRGEFPDGLLASLRWTTCSSCGLVHARSVCPGCAAPGAVVQSVTVRGTVKATHLFRTTGRIVQATVQNGMLAWVYHESGAYRRENGVALLSGDQDGTLRVRIRGADTVLAKDTVLVTLGPDGAQSRVDTGMVGKLPVYDTNARHTYWISNGRLVHDGRFGPADIGSVLPGQTLVWVGDHFGFGFYRAGSLVRGLVFDAERPGINDSVPLPVIQGNLIDATSVFADSHAWFMLSVQVEGAIRNHCYVVNDKAEILASTEAQQGDGTWLGDGIRGRLAMGSSLYAATDSGIVRVSRNGSTLAVDREFPDTEPFVDSASILLPGKGGIHVVGTKQITQLEIR